MHIVTAPRIRIACALAGAALTLLNCPPALPFVQVRSGGSGDPNELILITENWKVCNDKSQPATKRLADCTVVVDAGKRGVLDSTDLANVYVGRGQLLQDTGDDRAALADFNAAIKSDPKNAHAWLGRANYYAAKSDFADALPDYNQALKIDPNDPVSFDNRGMTLTSMGAHDEALADFDRALALDPHDLIAYSNRATLGLAAGHLDAAISDLNVVIKADPANGMAYYNRGTAYERGGDLERALADYRTAARLMPSFAPTLAAVGRLLKDKDPDAAVAGLSAAIRLDPRSPALRSRAILYLSMGRLDLALRDFDQVIVNDGSDSIAYLDRGVTNEKLSKLENAIADYNRSYELAPSAAARLNRGNAYALLQQPDKAREDFNAVLETDPKNVAALLGKANADYAQKRTSASLDDYTAVIAVDPNNVTAYFKRGNVHLDQHEFAAAFSDYTDSLKLNPNQAVALYNRSLAALRLGRRKDAEEDRRRALALDPSLTGSEERLRAK